MKGLVVYDSVHGNTKKVAETVAGALGYSLALVSEFPSERLLGYEHIIFGTPTHRLRATNAMINFIVALPVNCLVGMNISCYDTRMNAKEFIMKGHEFNTFNLPKSPEIKGPRHLPHPLSDEVEAKISSLEKKLPIKKLTPRPTVPANMMTSQASLILALLLHDTGAKLVGKPGEFIVTDIEGPLANGELERAAEWAKSLNSVKKSTRNWE